MSDSIKAFYAKQEEIEHLVNKKIDKILKDLLDKSNLAISYKGQRGYLMGVLAALDALEELRKDYPTYTGFAIDQFKEELKKY